MDDPCEASRLYEAIFSILIQARFKSTGVGVDLDNHAHSVSRRERCIV